MQCNEHCRRYSSSPGRPLHRQNTVRCQPSAGWRRAQAWLRGSNGGLLALALVVGAGAGVGAIVFRWLIRTFTLALSGHADYSAAGHAANPHVPGLGRWFVVLAPVVAGLLYGPLVHLFAREARGHGVPEVMYAVARRGGRIAPQVAGIKALASALCIGGGGSVGREGPIVQIGSALGSTLGRPDPGDRGADADPGRLRRGRRDRRDVQRPAGRRVLRDGTDPARLHRGVLRHGGGLLGDRQRDRPGRVRRRRVLASAAVRGDQPDRSTCCSLCSACWPARPGCCSPGCCTGSKTSCDWAWRGPEWLRPAVGGILLGGVLLVVPEMYGVGYPVLGNGVAGKYTIAFLLALLAAKMLATSLTIGIGGSGGVFAPSLFIGAMLGAAYGQSLHHLAPGLAGPAGAYALIGMGAVFAGAARAPITAVIIMFELTGEYSIILPLMAAIVLATGVSHLLSADSIYTLKLRRRGVDLDTPPHAAAMMSTTVAQVMDPIEQTLPADTGLLDAAGPVSRSRHAQLAITDDTGAYLGVLTARAVADALADGQHDDTQVGALCELPPTVTSADRLDQALDTLETSRGAVPVLDADHAALVGWLTHQQVLAAQRTTHRHHTATATAVKHHERPNAAGPAKARGQRAAGVTGRRPRIGGPPHGVRDAGTGQQTFRKPASSPPRRRVGVAARRLQPNAPCVSRPPITSPVSAHQGGAVMAIADEPTPVITADGLTRRFGAQRGVTDVSFQVTAGEVFGFLGPNGAGKSTTIRLLLGLYRPTSGRIRVFGLDPLTDSDEIHRRVGYLPGELALFPLTGRQHLDRFGRMRGLTDLRYRDELVGWFGAELDRPVRTLSKGNRQKIGLVLAFMHRPELLVLDEPTSGLDPLLQDRFARLVRETVADGHSVFLSSHELDEVQRVVDRLAIIKDGRIVVTDTVDGLRSAAPRTVEFRFANTMDPQPFADLDGVQVMDNTDGRILLSITGPIGRLLQLAAGLDPVDMTARPADLDELFLRYYRSGTHPEAGHVR